MTLNVENVREYANVCAYMAISGFGGSLVFWFVGMLIRVGIGLIRSIRTAV